MPRFSSAARAVGPSRRRGGQRSPFSAFAWAGPLVLGTRTSASVASASVKPHPERHFPARTPSGRPWQRRPVPSTSFPLPRLVLRPTAAPLFTAGAKLPSRKLSSHLSQALAVEGTQQRSPRIEPDVLRFPSHCFRRRQQVAGDGYLSGRNRHAAPVCSTQRIPSRHARFEAHGRPRLSFRLFGSGNSGSIISHCVSVIRMYRFLLTPEAHLKQSSSQATVSRI